MRKIPQNLYSRQRGAAMFVAVALLALAGLGVALSNGLQTITVNQNAQLATAAAPAAGEGGDESIDAKKEIVDRCFTNKTRAVNVEGNDSDVALYLKIEDESEAVDAPKCLTCFDHPTQTVAKDGKTSPARICIESGKDEDTGKSKIASTCGDTSVTKLSACSGLLNQKRTVQCNSSGTSQDLLRSLGVSCGESISNIQAILGEGDKGLSQILAGEYVKEEVERLEKTLGVYKSQYDNLLEKISPPSDSLRGLCDNNPDARECNQLGVLSTRIRESEKELGILKRNAVRLSPTDSKKLAEEITGDDPSFLYPGVKVGDKVGTTFTTTKPESVSPYDAYKEAQRRLTSGAYGGKSLTDLNRERLAAIEKMTPEQLASARADLEKEIAVCQGSFWCKYVQYGSVPNQRNGEALDAIKVAQSNPVNDDDYYTEGELGVGEQVPPATSAKPPAVAQCDPADVDCASTPKVDYPINEVNNNNNNNNQNNDDFRGPGDQGLLEQLKGLGDLGGLLSKLLGGLGGGGKKGGGGGGMPQPQQQPKSAEEKQNDICKEKYPGTSVKDGRCTCPSGQFFTEGKCQAQKPKEPSDSKTSELMAELSCAPKEQGIGAPILISFACRGPEGMTLRADGFDAKEQLTGSAEIKADIEKVDPLTKMQKFALTCIKDGKTESKSCEVRVVKAALVLVANPSSVNKGEQGKVGWITAGARNCTVSASQGNSDEVDAFNNAHQNVTQVNGTADTPPLSEDMEIVVKCKMHSGEDKEERVTVKVRS
jgi:hypothetical protein